MNDSQRLDFLERFLEANGNSLIKIFSDQPVQPDDFKEGALFHDPFVLIEKRGAYQDVMGKNRRLRAAIDEAMLKVSSEIF